VGQVLEIELPRRKDDNWSDTMASRLVTGLFRSRNHVWDNDHRIVAKHGLTWTQYTTLMALRSAESDYTLSPSQIYAKAQVSSGGLTKMLHALESEDLVTRIDNPEDKRSRFVKLTPAGKVKVELVTGQLVETNTALFTSILSDNECEQLIALLSKLRSGLEVR